MGRDTNLLETKIINYDQLIELLKTRCVSTVININEDLFVAVLTSNLNHRTIKKLKSHIDKIENIHKSVKSNVAIAAAITAYAQIEMIKFKMFCQQNAINIYYSDTDSIFTDKPLPNYLCGVKWKMR